MRFRWVLCFVGLWMLPSCGSGTQTSRSAERPTDLTGRELRDYDALLEELPSPCGKNTSLADCVQEPEKCKMCSVAAEFVARSIRYGALPQEVEARYTARFDPALVHSIDTAEAPVHGPLNAPVTIVEFADFQCPYCASLVLVMDSLVETYAPHVRVVFRDFPLQHHPNARLAAQAGVAAHKQGKFWELHHIMFAHREKLEKSDIDKYARNLNLDMKRFREDWDSSATKVRVQANYNQGEALGIRGVPALFINGRAFEQGLFDLGGEDLTAWIELEIVITSGATRKK